MPTANMMLYLDSIESQFQVYTDKQQEIANLLKSELDRRANGNLTLIETRFLINYKVRELLRRRGKRVLLIMSPPGSGKSAIVTKIINRYLTPQKKCVAWFGSQHSQFDEFKYLRNGWDEMWGRVFTPDTEEKISAEILQNNCVQANRAIALAKKGYDVPTTLCKRCPIARGNCAYYNQFMKKGHKYYVHQHLFTPYWADADLVVIDEFSPAIFLDTLAITEEQLSLMARKTKSVIFKALELLLHGDGEFSGAKLYTALNEYVGKLRQNRGVRKPLDIVVRDLNNKSEKLNSSFQSFSQEEIRKVLPRQLYVDFPSLLTKEIAKWQCGEDFNGQISVLPANYFGKRELSATFRKSIEPSILQGKPIIILTATGDPQLIAKLLQIPKEDVEVFRPTIRVAKEVKIIQITGALNSAVTMSKPAARKRVLDKAKQIMDNSNAMKTCLIAHLRYETELAKGLGLTPSEYRNKKIEWHDSGHFWGIKGTNTFEGYEQLLVIGNPTPNPHDLLKQVRAFYHDTRKLDERPQRIEKAYLCALPKGNQATTEVLTYHDDRINRYLESLREGELLQSIYRIRPLQTNKRRRIRILLFTAQQIDGIQVEVVSAQNWHQIVREKTIQTIVNTAKHLLSRQPQFCIDELIPLAHCSKSTIYKYSGEMIQRLHLKYSQVTMPRTCKDGRIQSYLVTFYSY